MPRIPTEFSASAFIGDSMPFASSQVAINQSAVALKLNVNTATNGSLNITGIPARFKGSIVGIRIVLTANKTAGTMTFTPTINGTAITTPASLVNVAVANATSKTNTQVDAQQIPFAAGDLIGVKMTTDGSYAPTTNDVYVLIDVEYEGVQL